MKKLLFILISLILVSCSSTKNMSNTAPSNAPLSIPEGQSVIYIVRPSFVGKIINFNVTINDSFIGTTKGKQYIYTIVKPGKYALKSKAENEAILDLNIEPNKEYFIEQKVKMGAIKARNKLILLSEEEGKLSLAKCKLSKNFTSPSI